MNKTQSFITKICKFAQHGDTLHGEMMHQKRTELCREIGELRTKASNNQLNEVLPRWRGDVKRQILLLPPIVRINNMSMSELENLNQKLSEIKDVMTKYDAKRLSEIVGNANNS